ncbi:MAG: hypothetical protein DMF49_12765, partial [Acidobacteria bacterium]
PGANGVFDGAPPSGDDIVSHFDTSVLGLGDPEGVSYNADNDSLFIVSRDAQFAVETTTAGVPIRNIDFSSAGVKKPAAVAYAPGSVNPAEKHLYISDRGVDNNTDPNENDGKVVELALNSEGIFNARVAASSDDAEEKATGRVSLTSNDLELVFDGSNQTVGMRFKGVGIPRGATILSAYVQFTVKEATSTATPLTIQGQAADNAPAFTSAKRNVSSRPRTLASVSWSPDPWLAVGDAGPAQRTPDLSSVIAEIASRPGWTRGNALALIVTGSGHRVAHSYDGSATDAPLLHVEYRP